MTVIASPLVAKTDSIASVDDLWEPSTLFLPNWEQAIRLGTSYRGIVQASRSQSEQRYILAEKPRRSMTYRLRSYNSDDSERVRAFLARASRARTPIPFWPDITLPVGRKNITDNIYIGDFRDRRFQVGARMCAVVEDDAGISTDFKYSKILSVSDTELEIEDNLNETYDNGAELFFERHWFPHITPRLLWASTDHQFGGGSDQPTDFSGLTEGDWVIGCLVFQPNITESLPINVTKVEAVIGLNNNGFSPPPPPEFALDITSSLVANLTHPGDPGIPVREPRTMALVAWKVTEQFFTRKFRIEFTLDNDSIGGGLFSFMLFRNLHAFTPIVETPSTTDAAPDFINSTISTNPVLKGNRILSFHWSGAFGTSSYSTHLPAAAIERAQLPLGGGDSKTQYLVLDYTTPDDAAVDMIGICDPPGSFETEGWLAAAIVMQPKEDPGLSTGLFFPVIEADLELSNKANTITDAVNDASLTVVETPGTSGLDPEIVPGTTPAGYDTYDPGGGIAYPILHLPIDWEGVQTGIFRVGKRDRVGISTAIQVFGDAPGATFILPFIGLDRIEAFDVLEFFDSRGGRAFPFWVFSPSPVLDIIAIGGGKDTIFVKANINERDWELFPYLGIFDKTTGIRSGHTISSVSESSGVTTLVFAPLLPDTDETRYELTTAHLCRLDNDGFDERWITNTAQRVALPCKELTNEDVVQVVLDSFCGPGGGIAWFPDNVCDPCSDFRCGTDTPPGCCICAEAGVTASVFCYDAPCLPDNGGYGPCESVDSHSLGLLFQSCDTGPSGPDHIRWATLVFPPMEGEEVWVELNYVTGQWTTNIAAWIINLSCIGLIDDPGKGPCVVGTLCPPGTFPPIITHSCLQYTEQHICGLEPLCEYRVNLAITGSGLRDADPVCA